MATKGHRVICEILRSKAMNAAVKAGINKELFRDATERRIFTFIDDFWRSPNTHRQYPTVEAVARRFPVFKMLNIHEDEGQIEALISELRDDCVDSDVEAAVNQLNEYIENGDKAGALDYMKMEIPKIAYKHKHSGGFGINDVLEDTFELYTGAQSGKALGIPWLWDPMTKDTRGKKPGDLICFYGRMKSMKCVCEGQRIMLPDGSYAPIEEVPEETEVPSYTESTRRVRMAAARRVVSGIKPSVEVVTESGLRLRTGDQHLYMVPGGYERICNLLPGDYIATARRTPDWRPSPKGISVEDGHFLGLLVGDGNYTRHEVQFTNEDQEIIRSLSSHAKRWKVVINQGSREIEYRIVVGGRRGTPNPVLDYLRELGIHGQKSKDKRVPQRLFCSSKEAIAAFLAGLLDTDGTVGERFLAWSSASLGLLQDVQHLLMRFGIRGRIKEVFTNYGTLAYQLYVYSKELAILTYEYLSPYISLTRKKEALKKLANRDVVDKRNTDAIPYSDELYDLIICSKGNHEWPKTGVSKFDRTKVFTDTGTISRKMLTRIAEAFESSKLQAIADTDIIWEKIMSIESIGDVMCYDICIEDGNDPNFIVEGFVVHNTWLLLANAVNDVQEHKQRVLIWSKEMSKEQLAGRIGSILLGVDYQLLKNGILPKTRQEETFKKIEEFKQLFDDTAVMHDERKARLGVSDLVVLCGRSAPSTVKELENVINMWSPDICYIDSYYHMRTERAERERQIWAQQQMLAEDLKDLATACKIPLVLAAQANRLGEKLAGENLTEVAGTDALARETDLIVRVLRKVIPELEEDDYEGEFKREKEKEEEILKRLRHIRVSNTSQFAHLGIPKSALRPNSEATARKGAELCLVLGGNREGTLEAFTIDCVPGYRFSVKNPELSSKEVKEWTKNDEEVAKKQTTAAISRSVMKKQEVSNPIGKPPKFVPPKERGVRR